MRTHSIRRVGSAAFSVAAAVLLVCAIFWPAWAEAALHSRLAASLFAAWFGGVAFLLHPELSAGLAQGIREFRKATREIRDDFDRWF